MQLSLRYWLHLCDRWWAALAPPQQNEGVPQQPPSQMAQLYKTLCKLETKMNGYELMLKCVFNLCNEWLCASSPRDLKKKRNSERKNYFFYFCDVSVTSYATHRCITDHKNLYDAPLIIYIIFFRKVVGVCYQK